jgi:hypothetical protein
MSKKKKLKITGSGFYRNYEKKDGKYIPNQHIILRLEGEIPDIGLGLKEIAKICLDSD